MLQLSEEEKQFLRRLDDRLERVENRYQDELTDFLEPRLQLVAEEYLHSLKFHNFRFCGGYDEAERKRLVLFSEYSEIDCSGAEIQLIRFTGKMDYVSVTHRDFLGAVMSLGLRREKFGDLVVTENGCDLFAEADVADYLLTSELRVKHVPMKATMLAPEMFVPPEQKVKEVHIMVSSMRLDAILAAGLGLSRTKAVEQIQAGNIKINHTEVKDNDYVCRESDLLSCRGNGRLRVGAVEGETRKGKQRVTIWKYL